MIVMITMTTMIMENLYVRDVKDMSHIAIIVRNVRNVLHCVDVIIMLKTIPKHFVRDVVIMLTFSDVKKKIAKDIFLLKYLFVITRITRITRIIKITRKIQRSDHLEVSISEENSNRILHNTNFFIKSFNKYYIFSYLSLFF